MGKPDNGHHVALLGSSTLKGLVRACHPEPTAAVTAVAATLAGATGRPASGITAAGVAVLAGQLSVGWHNDWLDADRDLATHRPDKPIATGLVARRTVGVAAGCALTACVPLSLLSGWRAAVAHLSAVVLAWMYNSKLKGTVLSWFPYAASFALLVVFVSLGRPGHPYPAWWATTAAALLGVGAHFANVVPDLADDAATGIRGLPHRLGRSRSVAGATGLLLAGSAVVAFGPGRPGWTALGLPVGCALVGGGVVAYRRGRPTLLFRVSLVVALIDVAMLVSRGRQL